MTEFTTKQIAELVGVTKPTIQKAINELNIQPERKDNNNRGYYGYADVVSIIKKAKPNFDFSLLEEFSAKPQNETAKPQNETPNTAKPQNFAENLENQTEKPKNEELEFLKKALAIIEAQLAEKDKQLEKKDEQIKDLNNRLAEALQLTKGQQYIAAADKTTELLEADNKKEVVINETAAAEENPISAERKTEEVIPEETEKPKKKSFWQRLFGR